MVGVVGGVVVASVAVLVVFLCCSSRLEAAVVVTSNNNSNNKSNNSSNCAVELKAERLLFNPVVLGSILDRPFWLKYRACCFVVTSSFHPQEVASF